MLEMGHRKHLPYPDFAIASQADAPTTENRWTACVRPLIAYDMAPTGQLRT